ncbi:MAG: hypothetical protein VXZ96_18190 [Myxococcota bacterium]|nr:hypothetical protein [Myxococcota bacterium]
MIWFCLLGCRGFEIETESLTLQCSDTDLEADSTINWETDGENIVVWRNSVYKSSSAIFTPKLSIEEDKIDLREFWEDDDNGEQYCFNPTIRLLNPEFESAELWWFLGDETISEDIAELEID